MKRFVDQRDGRVEEDATDNWQDLGALVEWSAKGTVATMHSGTVVQAL